MSRSMPIRCWKVGAPALAALVVSLTVACVDQGPEGYPGVRIGTLVSPNGPEGAALIQLVGEDIGSLAPLEGSRMYEFDALGSATVALVDTTGGGTLGIQIFVQDTSVLPRVTVLQVAGPDDQLRASLAGYRVEWGP